MNGTSQHEWGTGAEMRGWAVQKTLEVSGSEEPSVWETTKPWWMTGWMEGWALTYSCCFYHLRFRTVRLGADQYCVIQIRLLALILVCDGSGMCFDYRHIGGGYRGFLLCRLVLHFFRCHGGWLRKQKSEEASQIYKQTPLNLWRGWPIEKCPLLNYFSFSWRLNLCDSANT